MNETFAIILAAGLGKRLGGDLPKAIAKTRQGALIDLVLGGVSALKPKKVVTVVGHKRELVEEHVTRSSYAKELKIEFAPQEQQLGTGHAVRSALSNLSGCSGTVLISYADHPLYTPETLKHFLEYHHFKRATLSLISFNAPPPNGYGRVVRDSKGEVLRITEARDCNPEELLISEVNSGVFAVDSAFLKPAVEGLTNDNSQGEFYLTDIVSKAVSEGQRVVAFPLGDPHEAAGVNTLSDLHFVNETLAARQIAFLQSKGVHFTDPRSVYIDPQVEIASGVRIGANVELRGETYLAPEVVVEGGSLLLDAKVEARSVIRLSSRVEGATIGSDVVVGPFANLRAGTVLGDRVRVGNFVEIKNSTLASGAKASHLTYLGDCSVGSESNIGAGTITCNYDGYKKSKTEIGSGVFVGSNSSLVAPLKVGDGALIAAGSVITKDVPEDSLGVARAQQTNRLGWAKKRRQTLSK